MANQDQNVEPWFLKSNFPVGFPSHSAFTMSDADFATLLQTELKQVVDEKVARDTLADITSAVETAVIDGETDVESTLAETTSIVNKSDAEETTTPKTGTHRMVQGLVDFDIEAEQQKKDEQDASEFAAKLDEKGLMLTENMAVAHRSTKQAVVDMFYELEPVVSGERLKELLTAAWKEDPVMTLKIIYNARSIHLGKGAKYVFYRCAGWLAKEHPLTLVNNLRWLSRPVIPKKAEKKDGEDDLVMVDVKDVDESDPAHYDVRFGVAHGYWKDLLNILVLNANDKLDVLADPSDVFNVDNRKHQGTIRAPADVAKVKRAETRDKRHENALDLFKNDPMYRALHIAITRLFAEQLKCDLALLRGTDNKAKRTISPCGKWAPTQAALHDKHTFIVSSIAEILHPVSEFDDTITADRDTYLRYARDAYRKDISSLRAHLEVVERDITTETFEKIKYDRVPSIAMNNYSSLFARKDEAHFGEYLTQVAGGHARISGAILLPSTLVMAARGRGSSTFKGKKKISAEVQRKIQEMEAEVVDAQWKTLVQRIRDSGTLDNSIAVCDVSGSMQSPQFRDGTTPLDSAIGLALLLAEVTEAPFGGHFITFSANPRVEKIDLSKSLREKIAAMNSSDWGMNTDFVAVFERLILRMAIKNKLKQEEMVKRIFVFSDMQFDEASSNGYYHQETKVAQWVTNYDRVKKLFEDAGYEIPELVFWNLAGGRAGYGGGTGGDETAPKPATVTDVGTVLVSGYSQGMLKVFLDNGGFEDPEAEEDVEEEEVETKSDDEEVKAEKKAKRQKTDPMAVVRKAVGHKAYEMLRVFD